MLGLLLLSTPTTLPARASVLLEKIDSVQSVVLSPDGQTAYVTIEQSAVRLWPVFVHYWPEWGGLVAAMILLVLFGRLVRIMKRRRAIGEPHCRYCNYQLTGLSGDQCPECGKVTVRRGPAVGRPIKRRVVALAAAMVLVGGGYLGLRFAGMPRDGRASTWFDGWSTWAAASNLRSQLPSRLSTAYWIESLLEIDTQSGRIERRLYERTYCSKTARLVSADGRKLYLLGKFSVEEWDIAAWRRSRLWDVSEMPSYVVNGEYVDMLRDVAISGDGRYLLAMAFLSTGFGEFRGAALHRWDLATGTELPPIRLEQEPRTRETWARVRAIPGSSHVLIWGAQQARVIDPANGATVRDVIRGDAFFELNAGVIAADRTLIITTWWETSPQQNNMDWIRRWNLDTGEELPHFDFTGTPAATSTALNGRGFVLNTGVICAPSDGQVIGTADMGLLNRPLHGINATITVSSEGGTMAAWGVDHAATSPGPDAIRLLFYDLSPLAIGSPSR